MDIEERKLQLDREKYDFEKLRHSESQALEERRLATEVSSRRWGQLATFVPVLALVVGFFLNQSAERDKRDAANNAEIRRVEREVALQRHTDRLRFVERQLSDFYYPVKIRLERDNAVWEVSAQNKDSSANFKIATDIEGRLVLPNHDEIMDLLKNKFHLLVNDAESVDLQPLIDQMNLYQRHVTIYKALRDSKDNRYPHSVCTGCGYPKGFEEQINARIRALEAQRKSLIASMPRAPAS